MEIKKKIIGNFTPAPFSLTCLAVNNFLPIGVIDTLELRDGQVWYQTPLLTDNSHVINKRNTIKNILLGLSYYLKPIKIDINGRNYYFVKGSMFDPDGRPLMVLGMRKEAYYSTEFSPFSDSFPMKKFSYNNYVLLYAAEFLTIPFLAPLHRRFQKEILTPCFTKGIGVRMMPSSEIENNTFARVFEVKKTKTIEELDTFLKTGLANYLYEEEDISMQVPVTEEGLSVEEEALLFDDADADFVEVNPITSVPTHIGPEVVEEWLNAASSAPIQWVDAPSGSPDIIMGVDSAMHDLRTHTSMAYRTQQGIYAQIRDGQVATAANTFPVTPNEAFAPVNVDGVIWRGRRIGSRRHLPPIILEDDTED